LTYSEHANGRDDGAVVRAHDGLVCAARKVVVAGAEALSSFCGLGGHCCGLDCPSVDAVGMHRAAHTFQDVEGLLGVYLVTVRRACDGCGCDDDHRWETFGMGRAFTAGLRKQLL
jgi:hypothetical protein